MKKIRKTQQYGCQMFNNRKKTLSQNLHRVWVILAFMLGSLATQAQGSWDWSDCVDWFKYEGADLLATYAHPTNDMEDFHITQTSPDIIVTIDFEGTFVDFSSTYKVVRAYYNGRPYFKDVKILSERVIIKSFTAWDVAPKLHPTIYRENGFSRLYDGVSDFESLSLGRKAAAALTMEFTAKQ